MNGIWQGMIAETALSESDKVFVVIQDVDPVVQFGPCAWQPRSSGGSGGDTSGSLKPLGSTSTLVGSLKPPAGVTPTAFFPSRGDKCLVSFDQRSEPWIAVWWPYE